MSSSRERSMLTAASVVMYIQHNIAARSRNHCYRRKATNIACSECVSVNLGIQHAKRINSVHFRISRARSIQSNPSHSISLRFLQPKHYLSLPQLPHTPPYRCCVLTNRIFSDQHKSSNSIEEGVRNRITVGNKAYHANQSLFKSRLGFKKLQMKLYWSIIRPIVRCGSDTWVLEETIETKLMVDVSLTVRHELTIH